MMLKIKLCVFYYHPSAMNSLNENNGGPMLVQGRMEESKVPGDKLEQTMLEF